MTRKLDFTANARFAARRRGYFAPTASVYVMQLEGTDQFKIGRSAKIQRRRAALEYEVKGRLAVVYEFEVLGRGSRLEAWLHGRYSAKRIAGEWFRLSPADVHAMPTHVRRMMRTLRQSWRHWERHYRVLPRLPPGSPARPVPWH